ncbi:DNA mismatch repair endonuclease MutL [Halobacteriaceae archaeon SHR40]|uniref:DNA mismatch repair endonuclease MutL n=1 Tax=Halovenus amylolytica TaxID=2500550 RepID=UPI000FE36D50
MTGPEITALDAQTVERIAAGEVVERPASAVKELLENSIDADATRATVTVESGGRERIQVTDDGIGMSRSAVERAVEEHTTSKITDIADLERGVGTLGFRGEALHAIGAVSRLTITTRPRDGDRGTELTVEGGEISNISPAGCPEGTTVEVEDLFYNVPARRKYLKQDATEFAHVNTVVTNYALANPDVAITLEHNGRETFATNGTGSLQETVLSVYGREVAEAMIDVDGEAMPDGPLDGISGVISHPETNRASRDYLSTFVNGRYVTANTVREAVVDAYGGQLAGDRYPFAVLYLDVDPGTVDVNVHPRKMEVRFADEAGIREQIETVVEGTLLEEGLIRSSAPRGRSAPDQTEITPEKSRSAEQGVVDADTETADATDATETTDASDTEETASRKLRIQSDSISERTDKRTPEPTAESADTESGAASSTDGTDSPERANTVRTDPADSDSPDQESTADDPTDSTDETTPPREPDTESTAPSARKFADAGQQARLAEDENVEQSFESLPPMRVLGQLQETYIVAETGEGMVLIDQHAADERINYERLRESLTAETTTQALAEPVTLELTAREAELFTAHEDALATLGFRASQTGDRTVEVTTVPSLIAEAADPALLRDVLGEFVADGGTASETVEAAADELLSDLACYPSITGNTSLTEGSIVDLLGALDDCENPYACPHGRPVIVEFDTDELEARFERDYPGHQH